METRRFLTILFTDIAGSTERATSMGDTRWLEILGTAVRHRIRGIYAAG